MLFPGGDPASTPAELGYNANSIQLLRPSHLDISVIIPSYNAQTHLRLTLDALLNQEFKGQHEIIVMDCSPHDEVEKICLSLVGIKYFRETERFNPGTGRNIGASHAEGRLLVFLDADVILRRDALAQCWKAYSAGNQLFGGCLELNTDVQDTVSSHLEHLFFNHESHASRRPAPRKNLSSALMAIDRDIFAQSGGFSDIPRMQDTELTERLAHQGVSPIHWPTLVGLQIQDAPLNKVLRKILINGKNLFYIRYAKRGLLTKLLLFVLLPLISAGKVIRIIGRHLFYQNNNGRIQTIALTPLLLLGGFYWMLGFYHSLIFGQGISDQRD